MSECWGRGLHYLFKGRSSFRKCRSPGLCMSLSKCREWERGSLEGKKGGGRGGEGSLSFFT